MERLRVPAVLLVLTHLVGAVGYRLIWADHHATLLDALFMTFTTITTIGFAEVYPLDSAGRVLTMGIAGTGIGSLFYTFTVLLDYASSEQVRVARRRRKMQKTIDDLKGHFILAGIGRVGREAAAELTESGVSFVVVDPGPQVPAFCEAMKCPYVQADATEDTALIAAGVKRAKGLIVTTSSDATNLYVILSARLLNADLLIASRAVDDASVPKLIRAGANRAISPYATGGRRLAHVMLNPRVVDFLETALTSGNKALNIDDVVVVNGGKSIESLQVRARSGATVLAVVRDGQPMPNPRGDLQLASGDHLLVLGTTEQLKLVEQLIGG
ncbi:MAG: TrkA family potassium uptake protein [Myxococcales bacterium]|nr:TrkA family potassium uptake protein [Myxococcales bacterium]